MAYQEPGGSRQAYLHLVDENVYSRPCSAQIRQYGANSMASRTCPNTWGQQHGPAGDPVNREVLPEPRLACRQHCIPKMRN